jgi:hypothetical protein
VPRQSCSASGELSSSVTGKMVMECPGTTADKRRVGTVTAVLVRVSTSWKPGRPFLQGASGRLSSRSPVPRWCGAVRYGKR